MTWYYAVLAVLLLGGVAVLAAGRGGAMAEVERPGAPELPDGRLDAGALRAVKFRTAFRGYRMDEVDALLDRLAAQAEADDPARPWTRGAEE